MGSPPPSPTRDPARVERELLQDAANELATRDSVVHHPRTRRAYRVPAGLVIPRHDHAELVALLDSGELELVNDTSAQGRGARGGHGRCRR